MERIGFVGAGLMGEGMAANALKAGHELSVLAHRKRAAVERLIAAGAREAENPADLAASSDVIVFCLSNADTVRSVIAELRAHLKPGQLIIDTSTSDPTVTRRLAEELREGGIALADAPVTGAPSQAAAGELSTLLGSAEADRERAKAVVGSWSRIVEVFGDVGAGHAAKLINNFITQGTTALLAEAYTRARRAGISWEALYAVQSTGAARSGTFDKMVPAAVKGNFQASQFSIENAAKDARYYVQLSEAMDGHASALATAVHQAIARFETAGFGDDHTSRMLEPSVADSVDRVAE